MSIVHDALKRAQAQRNPAPPGVPFGNEPPKAKDRTGIYVIAGVAVAALAVVAYLYIPAFHKPKVPVVAQKAPPVPAKPAAAGTPKTDVQGAARVPKEAPSTPAPAKTAATDAAPPAKKVETVMAKPAAETVKTKPAPDAIPEYRVKTPKPAPAVEARRKPVEEPVDDRVQRIPGRRSDYDRINIEYNEALNALNTGKTREAKALFQAILAKKPDHIESLNNMGVLAASSGNRKEAAFYFRRILEYRPNYAKAYNNLGLAMMSEDPQLAEEYFRKAVSLEPDSLEPYLNLTALLRSQKRFQEAAKALDVPIRRNVRDARLFLSYAVVKDNLGQSDDAIQYYRLYLEAVKSPEARRGIQERLQYLESRSKK